MGLYKELLNRRIPQIIASYFIAGATFILFMDWSVNRYGLAEYYTTMALFGVIAILPSVIILSYFHGAPGKDEWSKIEKVGVPINILFIMALFVIGHYSNWWFGTHDNGNFLFKKFYFHLSSSENYIKHYYIDYGFGKYDKDQFIVETLDNKILKQIRSSVFSNINSLYANQDLVIDASFSNEEQEILDTWTFHKINKLNLEQCNHLKTSYEMFKVKLEKDNNYKSETILPDYLVRYFVYKVTDIKNNEIYLIVERSGEFPSQTLPLLIEMNENNIPIIPSRWSHDYEKHYTNDKGGIEEIIVEINEDIYDEFYRLIFGAPILGSIIEILDDTNPMVKIKLDRPKLAKKKVRLKSNRTYHWTKGGAEIRIEDLNNVMSYVDTANIKSIWNHLYPDEPFDSDQAFIRRHEGITKLQNEIKNINNNLKNNSYLDETTTDSDDFGYYLEIIESIDSIAIAKVIDSSFPYYKIRIGDYVKIDK